MELIKVNNLKFWYDSQVNHADFLLNIENWHLTRGTFASIIGSNGCGKSTFLKLLARLIKPNSGEIYYHGAEQNSIDLNDYARKVSYVPQQVYSIFPYSVYEVVMMGRTPYLGIMGFEKNIDVTIVKDALEQMEVWHLRSKGLNEISGGEVQRVIIARALAQKAELILLDEPNSHLDIEHQFKIFNVLHHLNKTEGITVVTVSHDLNLVGIYSQEIVLMQGGSIILDGKKEDVLNEKNIKDAFNINSIVKYSGDKTKANVLINPIDYN